MHLRVHRSILRGLAVVLSLTACQRQLLALPTAVGSPGLSPQASTAPERSASVREIEGQVEARASASGEWADASEGLVLSEGGQVRTGTDARAMLLLTEGTKIRIGPNTAFTFKILNPFLDSLLTSLALERGEVWILQTGGALDVESPVGIASARGAYMNVAFNSRRQTLSVSCLQGLCSFGSVFIDKGTILRNAEAAEATPEPMTAADYGAWGVNVAEATQLAFFATEAVVQGNATLPIVATPSPTPTSPLQPEPTHTPASEAPTQSASPTAVPTREIARSTPIPFTPIPPAPIIGTHLVLAGETIFCIGRGYGVLPGAIAQTNGLITPFTIVPGQRLRIPQVQWANISPGPVCAPQFHSPFPGLPVSTAAPAVTSTSSAQALTIAHSTLCLANCNSMDGSYIVRFFVDVTGGAAPYTMDPGQTFDLTFPHCVTQHGAIRVTSADGQTASHDWSYEDVSCPSPASP